MNEYAGKRYLAVECDDERTCVKCDLLKVPCVDLPPCTAILRKEVKP